MVRVIGVPLDENSSYLKGAALAPARIRHALKSGSSNWGTELGPDLDNLGGWEDSGDMIIPSMPAAIDEIRRQAFDLLAEGDNALFLGGDHSVSFPLISAYAERFKNLNVLHLDAHSDTYDDFEGNPHSHASPFARILEQGNVARLVQVGIRTLNAHQRDQIGRLNIEVIEMRDLTNPFQLSFEGALYISLDMDCLDPAFAPGVSHHEPGGMSTRQVLDLIQSLNGKLVGADIVEFNPTRDLHDVTAMTAGKFYKELVARMLRDLE